MKLSVENVVTRRDRTSKNYSLENLLVFENHSKLKSYLLLTGSIISNGVNPSKETKEKISVSHKILNAKRRQELLK